MNVVLDTNVLLSAFLTDGICARILKRARHRQLSFVLCASVLQETKRLLGTKFSLTEKEIDFFVSLLSEAAEKEHHPAGVISGVCRDPDDDWVLLCAVEAGADFLVTGDNDLLVLNEYRKTKILRPRGFELLFRD